MTERPLPRTADVVIIGGGILGLSVAWHLTRTDGVRVVVIERQSLASQATGRAAALLTLGRTDARFTRLVQRTFAAIEELGSALGAPLPLHRYGSLSVTTTAAGRRGLQALIDGATSAGVSVETVRAADAGRIVPWLTVTEDAACAFCPDDAFIDPYLLASSYGTAARQAGATIVSGTAVTGLSVAAGGASGVSTTAGTIAAPVVVVAAGAWSNLVAASVGTSVPMAPVRSQYWITMPDARFPRQHPCVSLPDARAYTRPELGALLFGIREANSVSLDPRHLPEDTQGYAFADDPDGMASLEDGLPPLRRHLPALDDVGIRAYVTGFSTYTPDGLPAFGTAAGIAGLLFAGGCSGAGIAISGGVGLALAELALGRTPGLAIDPFRCDRFGAVDPFDPTFRARCAAARSNKRTG
jgi:4-methylaminobutanoate oxidase (formaldehyde-forming)